MDIAMTLRTATSPSVEPVSVVGAPLHHPR
jgi:hypothetical protein